MRRIFLLSAVVVFLLSCGNNQSGTTETKTDSTTIQKDSAANTPGSNTVTPPASNGQY